METFFLAVFDTGHGKKVNEKIFHKEAFNSLPSNLKGAAPFSLVIQYWLLKQHGTELI